MSAKTSGHPHIAPRMPCCQRCDQHPQRTAVVRVLKSSDGDSRIYADLCAECYDEYQTNRYLDEMALQVNEHPVGRDLSDPATGAFPDCVSH